MLNELAAAASSVELNEVSPIGEDESKPILEYKPRRLGIFFWICVGWLGLLTFLVIFANLLPIQDPNYSNFNLPGAGVNLSPSTAHWLGTDNQSRDVFARLVYGARVSLVIGLFGTAIGIGIGGFLGMMSAYVRGKFDAALSFFMYTGLAFPAIVAVIAILVFWGRNEWQIIIVLGIFSVPLIFRLVRAATLSCVTKEYVTAAKSQGATAWRVIAKDIFPNVVPSLLAYTVFTFGGIIATEGALGFLGLSVPSPTATWGNMIGEAQGDINATLAYLLAPTIALFFTLISLNYAGERMRLRYDTSEQKL